MEYSSCTSLNTLKCQATYLGLTLLDPIDGEYHLIDNTGNLLRRTKLLFVLRDTLANLDSMRRAYA